MGHDPADDLRAEIAKGRVLGANIRLARSATDPAECQRPVEAAREAWTKIKRPDLVDELGEEFGEAVDPTPRPVA